MTDLHEQLKAIERTRVAPPDLWDDISTRRPETRVPADAGPSRRVVFIAIILLGVAVVFVVLGRPFLGSSRQAPLGVVQKLPNCHALEYPCPPDLPPIRARAPLVLIGVRLEPAPAGASPAISANQAENSAYERGAWGWKGFTLPGSREQAILAILPRFKLPTPVGKPQRYQPDTLVWAIRYSDVCLPQRPTRCPWNAVVIVVGSSGKVLEGGAEGTPSPVTTPRSGGSG